MNISNLRRLVSIGLILLAASSVFAAAQRTGSLVTRDGNDISGARLRALLDEYIPTNNAHSTLIVLTQCYGGDMVGTLANGRANTAVISATSPGERASYGGYDDDAAGALKPGCTSEDVNKAGADGKADGETPSKAGDPVSLDPINPEGPIKSRHILVYAGTPDGGGPTSDAQQRETIKGNFPAGPNQSVTSVGGAGGGAGGWNHPGTEQGLKDALNAIKGKMSPDEQFIMFVTDHGDLDAYDPNCMEVWPGIYESDSLEFDSRVYHEDMQDDPNNVPTVTVFIEQEAQPPDCNISIWNFNIGDEPCDFPNVPFSRRVDLNGNGVQDPGDGWEARVPIPEELLQCGGPIWVRVENLPTGASVGVTVSSGAIRKGIHEVTAGASNPSPTDGAQDVDPNVTLSWTPGDYTQDVNGHDVYFGTDFNDVCDANRSDLTGIYRGPNDVNIVIDPCDPNNIRYSYSVPESLDLVETYFWRVDEVNDPNVWKGDVWRFTTANYLVVDDIEDYNDSWDRIFFVWTDGYGWTNPPPGWPGNGTGSTVGYLSAPFCEQSIVHGGGQSMPYSYNNSGANEKAYYSEAAADINDLVMGPDWTAHGVKALTLYFFGDPNNDANATEQMYVGLEDSSGVSSYAEVRYGEDMSDVKIAEWQEWNIRLQDFNDGGVELTDVNRVYIGFGDRDEHPVPGGSGIMYFDNIRLYLPRCISEYAPAADITGDCVVDYKDLKIIADQWLNSGSSLLADLNDDNDVDLDDYSIFADGYLPEVPQLWPPQPPQPKILYPENGTVVCNNEYVLTIAYDESGEDDIDQVVFEYFDDGNWYELTGSSVFDSQGTGLWTIFWNAESLPFGDYPIRVTMVDTSGKTGEDEIILTLNKQPITDANATLIDPEINLVEFDGTLSQDEDGEIVEWMWDFGDDSNSEFGPIVEHPFYELISEEPYVILTVTDDTGFTDWEYYKLMYKPLVPEVYLEKLTPSCGCSSMDIVTSGNSKMVFPPPYPHPDGNTVLGGVIDLANPGGPYSLFYNFEVVATLVPLSDPTLCDECQKIKRTYHWGGRDWHKEDPNGTQFPYTGGAYTLDGHGYEDPGRGVKTHPDISLDPQIRWIDGPGWHGTLGSSGFRKPDGNPDGVSYKAAFIAEVSGGLGTCQCTWEVILEINANGSVKTATVQNEVCTSN